VEPFQLHGRDEVELGDRLIPKYRGMGLATEAAIAVSNNPVVA
jgi:RimJ/RimL family protein N-acetyltransferase